MKIIFEVDDDMERRIKAQAAAAHMTIGEYLTWVLDRYEGRSQPRGENQLGPYVEKG